MMSGATNGATRSLYSVYSLRTLRDLDNITKERLDNDSSERQRQQQQQEQQHLASFDLPDDESQSTLPFVVAPDSNTLPLHSNSAPNPTA
jgi:hypothetical protein